MTHRFPIKEIALQAGISTATVDRVLNKRAHVSPQTQRRVAAAIQELAEQETQLAARGRRLFFDVVVEAPQRFSAEVRAAAQSILPRIGTAVCRPRFTLQEIMREDEVTGTLTRILKRGSHGVILKARDTARIRAAVNALAAAGIPVVTLVTDIDRCDRLAYVGLDNAGAGRAAAYLVAQSLGAQAGTVLATRSHKDFLGEDTRARAFAEALARRAPNLRIVSLMGGRGVPLETTKHLTAALDQLGDLRAVYSMGGGNRAICEVLSHNRLSPQVYVAHDLDRDNRALIAEARLTYILHHDLQTDMRHAFDTCLAYHRLLSQPPAAPISAVQILTPENLPT